MDDDELFELVRRNYSEVNKGYLQEQIKIASELFDRIPPWRWTRLHKLVWSHGKKHGRPKKLRKAV